MENQKYIVIIPTYNEKDNIKKLIEKLKKKNLRNFAVTGVTM